MPTLTLLQGDPAGRVFEIDEPSFLVGRSRECNVVLRCDTVSRRHTRIFQSEGQYYVEDAGSTNGTFLNGDRVVGALPLTHGDVIKIDTFVLRFGDSAAAEQQATQWSLGENDPSSRPTILHELDVSAADLRVKLHADAKFVAMLGMIRSLGNSLAIGEVLDKLLAGCLAVFEQANRAYILLADGPDNRLRLGAVRMRGKGFDDSCTALPMKRSLSELVLREGRAVLSGPDEGRPAAPTAEASAASGKAPPSLPPGRTPATPAITSSICAPLKGPSRRTLGVLHVDTFDLQQPFSVSDLDVLASVAILAGQALEHSRMLESYVASERLAAIGQTLASVAHESNNDLLAIQLGLKMLARKVNGRADEAEIVSLLQRHQQHLQQVFDEVQGYAAPIRLERSSQPLETVWRQAWAQLEPSREGRQAELLEQFARVDTRCLVDAFRLKQVFRNLFENALAACSDPVRIEVVCRETRPPAPAALIVTVRDNGPGVPEEHRERIFDPFFTTKPRGTGLGLPIVRRIVEAHEGRLQLSDIGPPGAEFVLTLPRRAASP